jgi:translation initiation factor 2 alpha subunit (eIF-2alpha)
MKTYIIDFKLVGSPMFYRVLVTASDERDAALAIKQAWGGIEINIVSCQRLEVLTVIML